jgi:carbohydrate kinase (thermoresistant glucokinase family)
MQPQRSPLPNVLLVMGVSGSGKSTMGEALARELGWPFRDADSFHPAANVAKMSAGTALTDEDRWPWLAAIAAWIDQQRTSPEHGVVSCSALKRVYRQRLLDGRPDVRLVYLKGEQDLIAGRMARRTDHFMPPSLLQSQFAALEEPGTDERPLVVAIDRSPRRVLERILAELAREDLKGGA